MQNIFDAAEKLVTVRALPILPLILRKKTLAMNHKYKKHCFEIVKHLGSISVTVLIFVTNKLSDARNRIEKLTF